MDELETMLVEANRQKKPIFESIDLYYNDMAKPSESFVVRLSNAETGERTHFRRIDFFQGLKDLINFLHYRE